MNRAAQTGMEPVALSAMEMLISEDQRLYSDPLAVSFLPLSMKLYIWLCRWPMMRSWIIETSETMLPGAYAGVLARKKYMENKFREYHPVISNVVELGAGFDTFSLRFCNHGEQDFFELDLRQNTEAKAKFFHRHSLENKRVSLCAIDFDRENIQEVLAEHGFDPQKAAFVLWEGVTQYLTEDGIRRTFQWLETLAKDSCIAFTYVADRFIKGKDLMEWEAAYQKYVKKGVWKTGFDTKGLSDLLQTHGWRLQEDVAASEVLPEDLLRERGLKTSEVERMAFAIKS